MPSESSYRIKKFFFQLVAYLLSQEKEDFVEILNFSKKFYLGCLASVGFGLNIDAFSEKKSEFEKNSE